MLLNRVRVLARIGPLSPVKCTHLRSTPIVTRFTARNLIQPRRLKSEGRSISKNLKILWRSNPFSVTLAFIFIVGGFAGLAWTNYFYQSYIIGAFHKFPEPVAKELRKALFYTNASLEPEKAIKYYKEALRVADEVGMDPFSDEILGVKIQMAGLLEKIKLFPKSLEVLQAIRHECLEFLEAVGDRPGFEKRRDTVLRKTVQISVKMSDLYASPYIQNQKAAEEMLTWAVTTTLKELESRKDKNIEDPWLDPDQVGASLEGLGHLYEEKNLHYLAAPLFLQALTMSPPNSCHTAILMNNLSASIAQQGTPAWDTQPPTSRPVMLSNAREWAMKALEVATKIQPPERTEECDRGCAVATHNLGEFAEMDGDIQLARRKYEEAKSLAKKIQFRDGVENANAALRRLAEIK